MTQPQFRYCFDVQQYCWLYHLSQYISQCRIIQKDDKRGYFPVLYISKSFRNSLSKGFLYYFQFFFTPKQLSHSYLSNVLLQDLTWTCTIKSSVHILTNAKHLAVEPKTLEVFTEKISAIYIRFTVHLEYTLEDTWKHWIFVLMWHVIRSITLPES